MSTLLDSDMHMVFSVYLWTRLLGAVVLPVLLVAGAAGPVAAQTGGAADRLVIVQIKTAETAGTYTVSWRTLGGCDPGHGSSGADGTLTLTVKATGTRDPTPAPGELTGTATTGVVAIRPFCVYEWRVSFIEATTRSNCVVGPDPFAPDAGNEIRITVTDPATTCDHHTHILVHLHPVRPVHVDDGDHNAILATTFTAIAEPTANAPRECSTLITESTVDSNETPGDTTDDIVGIELDVVAITATGERCRYDVAVQLPRYLGAVHDQNILEDLDPTVAVDVNVGVATRTIYLLQHVLGDAGDAYARYDLSRTCEDHSGIPEPLAATPTGGIRGIEPETRVELREGRFNITAAIAEDPAADDAFDGVEMRVLDRLAEPCTATVSVSQIPEHCTPAETSLSADLLRTADRTVLEFTITCDR